MQKRIPMPSLEEEKRPTKEQQEKIIQRIRNKQKEKPRSLKSISVECRMRVTEIVDFLAGKDCTWETYCKLQALIEREENGATYAAAVSRARQKRRENGNKN